MPIEEGSVRVKERQARERKKEKGEKIKKRPVEEADRLRELISG